MKTRWIACLLLGACASVTVDDNEGGLGPTVEFDPGNKVIPFPNNLLLDPATGKVNLPEQCNESATSAATRLGVLNKLDGFGTYKTTINVTFTEEVDVASLAGRVLLFERATGGEPADPLTAIPLSVVAVPGKTQRFTNQDDITACTDPVLVDQVSFISRVPLTQKSTYTVALLAGIKTAGGADFEPSFTWSLVREPQPVVLLDEAGNVILNRTPLNPEVAEDKAQLQGIDLLWNAHRGALTFLAGTGHDSSDILLAFEFNTQTIVDPLDPAASGSPASAPTALPLLTVQNLAAITGAPNARPAPFFSQCGVDDPLDNTQCLLRVLLGGGVYTTGRDLCLVAGCDRVSSVLVAGLLSKQYLTDVTNSLYTGTGTSPIPGAWNDPVNPTVVHDTADPVNADPQAKLGTLILLPDVDDFPVPDEGYPVVIFQHAITGSRSNAFGLMRSVVGSGFAVVAIDAPNHGSRAVRISNDTALGCADVPVGIPTARPDLGPDPSAKGQCYAAPFSSDLAATRDAFRQTVLDLQQLVTSLKACTGNTCGALKVDPTKIAYVGHSMVGGNLGTIFHATTEDIQAAVFNGTGAGWLDIIENTGQTEAFQCPLVDGLIDAGVLTGAKFDPDTNTGLCLTDEWKTAPGYRQFAVIGQWILDPADPANFAPLLGDRTFLLQRIDGDDTVPNIATDNEGAIAQVLKGDASCGAGTTTPSTALLAAPTQSHFLDYVSVAASTSCPPGNTFSHLGLLQPEPGAAGGAATVRLQSDLAFYLLANLGLL